MTNVVSFNGGPTGLPSPNQNAIRVLKYALEKAEAGEIIGVFLGMQHCDGYWSWSLGGFVSSYSLLGAIDVARADLLRHHLNEET